MVEVGMMARVCRCRVARLAQRLRRLTAKTVHADGAATRSPEKRAHYGANKSAPPRPRATAACTIKFTRKNVDRAFTATHPPLAATNTLSTAPHDPTHRAVHQHVRLQQQW